MSNIQNGPGFNTMLTWYLEGNMGDLSRWVAASLKERNKKVDEAEFISIVNFIMTDFEMRIEKFAEEEGKSLQEMYEILKKEHEQQKLLLEEFNKGQGNG